MLIMKENYPILEFDEAKTSILNPDVLLQPQCKPIVGGLPEVCVLCFHLPMLNKKVESGELTQVGVAETTNGDLPIFVRESYGKKVAVMHPQVGAPMSAMNMERLIVQGYKKFIILGGGAALIEKPGSSCVNILVSAVRDEGLSYHYLPPSREVHADMEGITLFERIFLKRNIPYNLTKTWTTDAFFRETHHRRTMRLDEGCTVVEMEAAAFYAVAKFRGVQAVQILTTGELVGLEGRENSTNWDHLLDTRENLFNLVIEAAFEWS